MGEKIFFRKEGTTEWRELNQILLSRILISRLGEVEKVGGLKGGVTMEREMKCSRKRRSSSRTTLLARRKTVH